MEIIQHIDRTDSAVSSPFSAEVKNTFKLISSALFAIVAFSGNAFSSANASPIEQSFKKEMPYADVRQSLLKADWLPLRDPQCWDNVGGTADVCNQLPEVESCSGDGHCVMHFANKNQQLEIRISTYGPYKSWNIEKEKASLTVKFWEILPIKQPVAQSCPSPDFDSFIQRFASDKHLQQGFTDTLVKVAQLESDDNGDRTQFAYTLATNYDGFNIRYQNGVFHFVDYNGRVDPDDLKPEIVTVGQHARLISYQYGMSEGNSYLFEEKNGCWYLTEEPESPAP
ncbi:hypothetical protein [Budvicia diplopodorum]|uniref:hypothetical protein n=1 Tax=Budvicia diplopodorum TaxID=1119056 RepID=UPI0013570447|nr:hypothetical protein [Budvicia diplopodorum]